MAYVEDSLHELKENVGEYLPKVVAAFANTEGGELIIGVRGDGTIRGVEGKGIDVAQRKIEEYIKSIVPVPGHSIRRHDEGGKTIIVVKVHQLSDGFCTFRGVFYYRYGSETEKLEGGQLKEFLISKNMMYFDKLTAHDASVQGDIDHAKVKAFLKRRSPAAGEGGIEEALRSLGLLAVSNGKQALNNAAILFFGKEPWKFIKQNEVRLVSFSGYDSSSRVLDKKDIHLTIPQNLEEAGRFIKMNTRTSYRIEGLKHVEIPEYPERVVREALVNALAHRDYFSADAVQIRIFGNRIEFINPGIPPGGVGIKDIGRISVKRNPVVYQLMRDMGYMEGLATGIPMMRQEMEMAGMQEPEFNIIGSFFATTLYNELGKRADLNMLNERQRRGIEFAKGKGRITSSEYAKINSVATPTAVADLKGMVDNGILEKIGITRGSFYVIAREGRSRPITHHPFNKVSGKPHTLQEDEREQEK